MACKKPFSFGDSVFVGDRRQRRQAEKPGWEESPPQEVVVGIKKSDRVAHDTEKRD